MSTQRSRRLPARIALLAVMVAAPLVLSSAPAFAAGDEDAVVALVNDARADAGCDPVTIDSRLTTAASKHAQDQEENGSMSHVGSDGSSFGERIRREGFNYRRAAENVAMGTTSPQRVMDLWMKSESHRANILNCNLENIGVARSGRYWTQDFATEK
ncbi:CAP domain-containing protein [Pseudonocardia sp. TRM90224]|uniref:CAP domain-containing protein n=1 Tax=Pseudonocardia sp. TRM90224 TaxID=2812678 RepID=UPI001E583C01|nr:CAP domain-containing protein [Pseudonocardia sp. TRM90224]